MTMKEFGKAKIYLYNQKNIPEVDKDELEAMKTEFREKKEQEVELQDSIKSLNSKIAFFNQ